MNAAPARCRPSGKPAALNSTWREQSRAFRDAIQSARRVSIGTNLGAVPAGRSYPQQCGGGNVRNPRRNEKPPLAQRGVPRPQQQSQSQAQRRGRNVISQVEPVASQRPGNVNELHRARTDSIPRNGGHRAPHGVTPNAVELKTTATAQNDHKTRSSSTGGIGVSRASRQHASEWRHLDQKEATSSGLSGVATKVSNGPGGVRRPSCDANDASVFRGCGQSLISTSNICSPNNPLNPLAAESGGPRRR